ncbi:chemotaxis protein CheD [Pararhodospirillum photometricum]|nr:chemotaxis protein CheD [Pararhodospirillum photometricum]
MTNDPTISRRRVVDPRTGSTLIRLQRSEHHVSRVLSEVLSCEIAACVALCVHDGQRSLGGMMSVLLPARSQDAMVSAACERYGVHVLERLFIDLERAGGRRTRLEARLYGGAERDPADLSAGPRTVALIERVLEEWGIVISEQDTGGLNVRRVQFSPVTGRARVSVLDEVRADQILLQEVRRAPVLMHGPSGTIEVYE